MRIANIVADSIVDGPGLRLTVFVQGCPHGCPGCHNPATHDVSGGEEMTVEVLAARMDGNPLLDGLTLSGGEPFCQAAECAALAREGKRRGWSVWTYTGYTYEELTHGGRADWDELLAATDVLVDGLFVLEQRSYAALYRGSEN